MSSNQLQEYLTRLRNKKQEYCQFDDKSLPLTVSPLFETLVEELFFAKQCFEPVQRFQLNSAGQSVKVSKESFITKCTNEQGIVIIPIMESQGDESHRSLVMIDHEKAEIEYFDSRGSDEFTKQLQDLIYAELRDYYPNYRYIEMIDFCPNIGPQKISKDLFCTMWRFLYLSTRVNYPDVDRQRLITELSIEPRQVINGYYCSILEYFVEYYPNFVEASAKYLELYQKLYFYIIDFQSYIAKIQNNILKSPIDNLILNEIAKSLVYITRMREEMDEDIRDQIRETQKTFTDFLENSSYYSGFLSLIRGRHEVISALITENVMYNRPRRPILDRLN